MSFKVQVYKKILSFGKIENLNNYVYKYQKSVVKIIRFEIGMTESG